MALIKCPDCGRTISNQAVRCPHCGGPVQKLNPKESQSPPQVQPQLQNTKVNDTVFREVKKDKKASSHKSSKVILIIASAVLLLLGGGIGGWFYYKNIYLPEKTDAEAPRYYTFANIVNLRSSKSAGADFNKIAELPYGTELITYEYSSDWSKVKVSPHGEEEMNLSGYISSDFILNKADFFLLHSIFGDSDSRDVISSSRCRRALLDYYKDNGYIGSISQEDCQEAGITNVPSEYNQWQIFCKNSRSKKNTVYYKKLYYKDSKYSDFAVIIKNIKTNERKLLYFYFDDDETPHFYSEEAAPDFGDISNISMSYSGRILVEYTSN